MQRAESEPGGFFGCFGVFFVCLSPSPFFFNTLKEISKEDTVRADAVKEAFLSLEINRALSPKETWTFPGNLLLHSKNSEGISIHRIF